MDQAALQTVIAGEASESDEEEVENVPTTQETKKGKSGSDLTKVKSKPTQAAIIRGEASESEDEEEIDNSSQTLPPLKVDTDGKGDRDDFTNGDIPMSPVSPTARSISNKPKYDSLLHKKLRERNIAFRRHLVDTVHQSYLSSAKDLYNTTQQLHKTQTQIMDASHNMKLLTNDLFYLEDKIDIVCTCSILPDINIQVATK